MLQILDPLIITVAVFLFPDSLQMALDGVIRGLGLQGAALNIKLMAEFLVRLPLAYAWAFGYLGLPAGGVDGIWKASIISMTLMCVGYYSIYTCADFDDCAVAARLHSGDLHENKSQNQIERERLLV